MDKLDKLKNLMELLQNDTITPKELEGFLKMVLEVVGKSKKELESLSKENVDYMNDVISYISKEHKNIIETVSQETGKKSQEIDSKMKEAKTLLKEIKSIKATPGKDGNDADEDSVVEKLLGKIKPPEETAEQIFDKINSLGEDFKFDSSKIVLPEDVMIKIDRINKKIKHGLGGSTARNLYQLGDVEVLGITNGQILKYQASTNTFVPGTDGGTQNLQEVTDEGATTTHPILITNTSAQLNLINNGAVLTSFQTTSSGYLKILPSGARVTIGEDVGSQNNTLNVMGSTGSTLLRIQDTDTNGTVGFILQNDAQRWDFKVAGNSSDKFSIRDGTNGIDKLNIIRGATGDISFVNFGSLGVGTTSPDASAKLDVASTTQGFLPPRMTTTQRDAISSPVAGLVIYNTTTSKLNVYTTAWEAITSS